MTWTLFSVLGCGVTIFINLVVPLMASRSLLRGSGRKVSWGCVLAMELLLAHVGISIGFHRYFSHRSFEVGLLGKWLLATLGTLSMQGGPVYWAAQHRLHHWHCEESGDPHSPTHGPFGFLHAHGGFLTGMTGPTVEQHPGFNMGAVRDLAMDPDIAGLVTWPWSLLHPLGVMIGIPLASHYIFGHHTTLWYLHVPQFLAWHATLSVNSATHTFGYEITGETVAPCRARNTPWLWSALLGEAWHANHHSAPEVVSNQVHWWEVDPQLHLLLAAETLGLVRDVTVKTSARNWIGPRADHAEWLYLLQMYGPPCICFLVFQFALARRKSPDSLVVEAVHNSKGTRDKEHDS